jgi:iron complex transport system substrate-binding protein
MPSDYIPHRIVSLQPSATLVLRDLGKVELLVACTKYCVDVCPEIQGRNIAIVSDSWTAQSEQIRKLQPDFVIASVPYQEKSVIEILKANTPFLALAPKKLADIYSDIAIIARIVNATSEGEKLVRTMQEEIEAVRQRTADLPRPRVFCEEWGKPLIASQLWVKELVEAAGGEFVGTPGSQISFEQVAAANPDVIIAAWCGAGDRVPLEKIAHRRNWEGISAVKNRRVYCIRDEYLNTPAPTLLRGLHALASAIHPEHFPQAEGLRCIGNTIL